MGFWILLNLNLVDDTCWYYYFLDKASCKLPSDTGNCRALFRMWHYKSEANKCEQFIFGGCGGNENKFLTEEECKTACAT